MPEGPEIRLAADRIERVLAGRVVRDAWFAFERLKPWEVELTGRVVDEVATRGKALLVRLEGGLNVYAHNQLYGRWYVVKAGTTPRTRRSLRAALHTDEHSALLYSASDISVLRDADLASHPFLSRLGPDVLDRALTAAKVRRLLGRKAFARRRLGGLLLDQGFLAGVGNYLRSEILFVAGVLPERRPVDLDADEQRAFAKAALSVSRRAYRTRGVTNDADIVRRLKAEGLPRRSYRHFVFGRAGDACHRCGSEIVRTEIAGRRLYACRTCQT